MAIFTTEKYPLLVLTGNDFDTIKSYSGHSEARMSCKDRITNTDLYNQIYDMVYPCEFSGPLFNTRNVQKDGWIINTQYSATPDARLISTYSKKLSDTEKLDITTLYEFGDIYVSIDEYISGDENGINLANLHINLINNTRRAKKTFTLEKDGVEFDGYKLYLNKDGINTMLEKYCTDLTSAKIFSRIDDIFYTFLCNPFK